MFTHLERARKKTHPAAVDKNEKAYNLKQLIIRRGIYYVCTRIRWLIFGIGFAPNHVRIKSPLRSLSRCARRTLLIVKVVVLRSYWRILIKFRYDLKNCNVLRFGCKLNFWNCFVFVGVIGPWNVRDRAPVLRIAKRCEAFKMKIQRFAEFIKNKFLYRIHCECIVFSKCIISWA